MIDATARLGSLHCFKSDGTAMPDGLSRSSGVQNDCIGQIVGFITNFLDGPV